MFPDIAGALTTETYHHGGYPNQTMNGENGHVLPLAEGVRRLTPLECERLQGFPDGWTDGQADSHRYRQLGNAVCVPVAEYIGHRLVRVAYRLLADAMATGKYKRGDVLGIEGPGSYYDPSVLVEMTR